MQSKKGFFPYASLSRRSTHSVSQGTEVTIITEYVSVTSSSFSALLDMLKNLDKSGRLLTKQSFVVEVMVLLD